MAPAPASALAGDDDATALAPPFAAASLRVRMAEPSPVAGVGLAPVSNRTDERTAVDALVRGAIPQAAELYGALAARQPENSALREAARILRAKLDAGAH
jgi:hypothetical protein